jgi:hypothetical protein
MAFQFDHNHIHPDVARVLRQVNRGGVICAAPAFTAKGVFSPSGKLNYPLALMRHTATVAGWLCVIDFSCGP